MVISLVVLALVVLLEIMDRLGITRMLERIMSPLVKLIGISPKVMPITLIGMTLSIIEDHLLMIAMGAHWFWIFILRLVFTLGLMMLIKHLSNKIPSKYLFKTTE